MWINIVKANFLNKKNYKQNIDQTFIFFTDSRMVDNSFTSSKRQIFFIEKAKLFDYKSAPSK